MDSILTPRVRDFSQFNRDVVFGKSDGKIIWQPPIGCWHSDKLFAKQELPAPYQGMSVADIHRALGCSERLYCFGGCFRYIEDPRVTFTKRQINETDEETVVETPVGKQVKAIRKTPNNWYFSHLKWEVETEDELRVAAWRQENATWKWDQARYEKLLREVGDLGAPTMYMPRMNVQSLYIERMGVERGVYAIYDWRDTVEAYFRATEENHSRLIDLINGSPIDIVCFGENVHAGTLSRDLFLKYHLPECRRRCEKLHSAGKFVCSHWDGNVKPLLQFARETGLDGIEAITPEPQGDVTLEEMKEGLGDELFLLDGIPAVYFDKTFSVETLEQCARRLIDLFAPRLVLGISDEISSTGDIERIRVVGKIVEDYNS